MSDFEVPPYTVYDSRGKILHQCQELAPAVYLAGQHAVPNGPPVYVLMRNGTEIVIIPPITWGHRAPHAIESVKKYLEIESANSTD